MLWHRLPVTLADAVELVQMYRAQMGLSGTLRAAGALDDNNTAAPTHPFNTRLSAILYQWLFAPFQAELSQYPHLLIVADKSWIGLPFATLLTDPAEAGTDPNHEMLRRASWMLRQHAITMMPSAVSLRAVHAGHLAPLPDNGRPTTTLLAIGDPVFTGTQSADGVVRAAGTGTVDVSQLAPLLGTRREVRAIAAAFPDGQAQVLLGEDTSEAMLAAINLTDRDVIVFATHGLIAGELQGLAKPALALTAGDQFNTGDLDQARSLLIGLNLPDVLAEEPLVRIANLSTLSLLALISRRMGQDDTDAVYDQIITYLSVPDITPPALRPDMVADAGNAQMVADVLDMVVNSDRAGAGAAARRATAQRWLESLDARGTQAEVRALSFAVNDFRSTANWTRATETVQALLARTDLDPDLRAMSEIKLAELQSYIAVAEGRPIDHIALANAFRAVFDTEDIAAPVRVDVAGRLVGAFEHGGHGYLAHTAGIEVWHYMRDVQRATAQAGESVAGQSKTLRDTADITIANGFDVTARPPDGTPPPQGLCQEIVEIEVCTVLLQEP